MLEYLLKYGSYALIFGGLLTSGLGVPIPEDVYVLASAALSQRGHMVIALAFVVCWFGIFIGDIALFHIVRSLGGAIYRRELFRRLLPEERRQHIAGLIEARGGVAIIIARHLPGFRLPIFSVAALHGMKSLRFMAWDAIGLCVSLPVFFSLGYFFADRVSKVREGVASVSTTVAVAVGVVAAITGMVYWLRSKLDAPIPPADDSAATPPGDQE